MRDELSWGCPHVCFAFAVQRSRCVRAHILWFEHGNNTDAHARTHAHAHSYRGLFVPIHAVFSVSALSARDGSYNTMGVFPGSGNARADYESTWAKRGEFLVKPGKAEPDFMVDDACSRLHVGCAATKWIAAK